MDTRYYYDKNGKLLACCFGAVVADETVLAPLRSAALNAAESLQSARAAAAEAHDQAARAAAAAAVKANDLRCEAAQQALNAAISANPVRMIEPIAPAGAAGYTLAQPEDGTDHWDAGAGAWVPDLAARRAATPTTIEHVLSALASKGIVISPADLDAARGA